MEIKEGSMKEVMYELDVMYGYYLARVTKRNRYSRQKNGMHE